MTKSDTGGPAFPIILGAYRDLASDGLTIRDWLAGQAIGAIIRQCAGDINVNNQIMGFAARMEPADYFAMKAYEIADAMLRERAKGSETP